MSYLKYKANAARRDFTDFPLSKKLKFFLGTALGAFFPGRKKAVAEAPFAEDHNIVNRAIRNGLYADAFKRKDHAALRRFLSQYWAKEAAAFHRDWNERFERMFLKQDAALIDELEKLLARVPGDPIFTHLYEVGCGGGQVLEYLHDRFPQLKGLIGIDLGEEQIKENWATCDQERLAFVAADANEWLPENAVPGCVIFANGGVFEYFLQSELEYLFSRAADSLAPVVICVIETVATDHDLETEKDSLVYGREMAFSHNYPHLLETAGFEIVSCSERHGDSIDGGGRWIRILAVKDTPA